MHSVTFTFDPDKLFDMVAAVGDGGTTLGQRLAGALLTGGSVDVFEAIGLEIYSVSARKAPESFQARNADWMAVAFKHDPTDLPERVARFGEEALELQQALGQSREDAHALVDYVFDRPVGEPAQEMGGTMTTLALLAAVTSLDMIECGERELARCSTAAVLAKIQGKRANRAGRGPLPGAEVVATNVTLADTSIAPEALAALVDDGTAVTCFGCGQAMKDGEPYYEDVNEGAMHAACCGPEPESFVDAKGEPLKAGDPIPAPGTYTSTLG